MNSCLVLLQIQINGFAVAVLPNLKPTPQRPRKTFHSSLLQTVKAKWTVSVSILMFRCCASACYACRVRCYFSKSVCPSHSGTVSKRIHVSSNFSMTDRGLTLFFLMLLPLQFSFSALTLLVGRQEGLPACKKTGSWFVGDDDLTEALHDL